jgi:1-acyl-sn-glycerol-3-phosphate acyltransferase
MIPARPSGIVCRFFDGYVTRHLRRHFHRVWVWDECGLEDLARDRPLLVLMTHFSWWDVLIGYWLARQVLAIESYAPMDEAQLRRYRILCRLGIYSIDRRSTAGLRRFLEYTDGLLRPGRAVWLTPQGAIAPSRRRPLGFQQGVAHLVRRTAPVTVLPMAVVYEFLEEPRPEVFIRVGSPRRLEATAEPVAAIARQLEGDLTLELDTLQDALDRRAVERFRVILEGRTGVSRVYDPVRLLRAWWTGRPDPPRHGDVVSDPRRTRR